MEDFAQHLKKIGLPPGSLIHLGEKKVETVGLTLVEYDDIFYDKTEFETVNDFLDRKPSEKIFWLNVDGIHDEKVVRAIGDRFGIHPLVQEDLMNTSQRPKVEDHDDYVFIAAKMLYISLEKEEFLSEHISIIITAGGVITFQEQPGDVFDPVRDRIKHESGIIRKMKSDFLGYALLDALVDNYFRILEFLGERLEALEQTIVSESGPDALRNLHFLKRQVVSIRRWIWPLRYVLSTLQKTGVDLIHKETEVYFRDIYDHIIQIIDTIEIYRDTMSGLMDIYLSSVSNRMNEVMKVLTVIATVFIPLTFIAGVYGMNFKYMPELEWKYGYFFVLGLMAVISIAMISYFHKKRWL